MKKILVIEDDRDFQDIYSLYLRSENYNVLQAFNGKEGLKVLEKEIPDLIILDLIMPVMDGEEFYVTLRAQAKWKDIPVIIATVNESLPSKIQQLGGFMGHLRKPFNVEDLLKKIKECLG